eukprot:14013598-Alexandrium_andersonii.AAC.1
MAEARSFAQFARALAEAMRPREDRTSVSLPWAAMAAGPRPTTAKTWRGPATWSLPRGGGRAVAAAAP